MSNHHSIANPPAWKQAYRQEKGGRKRRESNGQFTFLQIFSLHLELSSLSSQAFDAPPFFKRVYFLRVFSLFTTHSSLIDNYVPFFLFLPTS
jgi:hypothetical protein